MMYIVVIGLLLVSLASSEQLCNFKSAKRIQPLSSARDCLLSVPLNERVRSNTQQAIDSYIELNVFKDLLLSPPAPFEDLAIDLTSEVYAIKEQAFHSDFEFQDAIGAVFRRLRDPHSVFAKPTCYRQFTVSLPLALTPVLIDNGVDGDQTMTITFRELPTELQFVSEQYARAYPNESDLPSLVGRTITSIEGVDALEYVKQWADDNVYLSKNAHARFNRALKSDFHSWTLKYYGLPPKDTVTYVLDDGTAVVLRYVVHSSQPVDAMDLTGFCEQNNDEITSSSVESETPMQRFLADAGSIPASAPLNAGSLKLEVESDAFSLYSQMDSTPPVFVLAIFSFSPSVVATYADDMVRSLQMVQASSNAGDTPRLVISVMSNGGGIVEVGALTLGALFPHIYPLYGSYSIRHNDVSDEFAYTALDSLYLDPDTYMAYDDQTWYYPGQDIEFESQFSDNSVTHTYSSLFTFTGEDDTDQDFQAGRNTLMNYQGLDLPSTDVSFLTDGLCGSTCACFIKHARELGLGLFVGVGGFIDDGESPMDVASFAGGVVRDSTWVEESVTDDMRNEGHDIPPPMPTDAYLRFAFDQIYTWNDSVVDPLHHPLEFLINPVHIRLLQWPGPGDAWSGVTSIQDALPGVLAAMDDIAAGDACYMDMIRPTECEGPQHSRGGQSCVGGTWADECVIYDCVDGYKRVDDACISIEEAHIMPIGLILVYIVGGLVLVGGVVWVVSVAIRPWWRMRRSKKRVLEESPLRFE